MSAECCCIPGCLKQLSRSKPTSGERRGGSNQFPRPVETGTFTVNHWVASFPNQMCFSVPWKVSDCFVMFCSSVVINSVWPHIYIVLGDSLQTSQQDSVLSTPKNKRNMTLSLLAVASNSLK